MEKLTMTVEEAGKVLGISRPTAYKLVQRADFPVVRGGPPSAGINGGPAGVGEERGGVTES